MDAANDRVYEKFSQSIFLFIARAKIFFCNLCVDISLFSWKQNNELILHWEFQGWQSGRYVCIFFFFGLNWIGSATKKFPILTEDEELITNALETIVNLAPLLDLRIFSSSKPSFIKMTWGIWFSMYSVVCYFNQWIYLKNHDIFLLNREKRSVQAIMGMLASGVKAWHCAASELLGRLIINPDNEPFLLPFAPQVGISPQMMPFSCEI